MNVDRNGGVVPSTEASLGRAKNVDLVTLPRDVDGTRCNNCMYFSFKYVSESDVGDIEFGWCNHNDVNQMVSERQCCAAWNAKGCIRPWIKK